MKSSTKPGSRRTGGASPTKPRAVKGPAAASRTKDLSGLRGPARGPARTAGDTPGARRRAQNKQVQRRRNAIIWLPVLCATVVLGFTAAGVYSATRDTRVLIAQERSKLADLKAQEVMGRRKLQELSSVSGRMRLLMENGFIKPGQRILLMDNPQEKKAKGGNTSSATGNKNAKMEDRGVVGRLERAWTELRGG